MNSKSKKIVAILLVLSMIFTLAACGGGGGTPVSPSSPDGTQYENGIKSFSTYGAKCERATNDGGYVYTCNFLQFLQYSVYLLTECGLEPSDGWDLNNGTSVSQFTDGNKYIQFVMSSSFADVFRDTSTFTVTIYPMQKYTPSNWLQNSP